MENLKNIDFARIIKSELSTEQMNRYFEGNANIISRQQMSNFKTLAECFRNYECDHCIIFTATNNLYSGHFQCMYIDNGKLYFFDSYGFGCDDLVKQLKSKFHQLPILTTLISKSQYANEAYENSVEYQEEADDINTCGRYCLTVLIMHYYFKKIKKPFSLIDFYYIMNALKKKYNLSFDEIVSYFIDKV